MKKSLVCFFMDWLDENRRNNVLRAMLCKNKVDIEHYKAMANEYEMIMAHLFELIECDERGGEQ